MRRNIILILVLIFIAVPLVAQKILINHESTDYESIPESVIEDIKSNFNVLHAHLSHGFQIDDGLDTLGARNDLYRVKIGNYELPSEMGALNILYYYADSYAYWRDGGTSKLRSFLDKYPQINVSVFSWCRDLDTASAETVQAYLDTLNQLEEEYPGITFVYMTGNAQKEGAYGYNRYRNNQKIREYCAQNNKVLYDFADLDCWWYNPVTEEWENSTYSYNGEDIPVEHPEFHHEIVHHTTEESCEQKAKAFWYLLARLDGWQPETGLKNSTNFPNGHNLSLKIYPNPFNPETTILLNIPKNEWVRIRLSDITGRTVLEVYEGRLNRGEHKLHLNGDKLSSGLYFLTIQSVEKIITKKISLIK